MCMFGGWGKMCENCVYFLKSKMQKNIPDYPITHYCKAAG